MKVMIMNVNKNCIEKYIKAIERKLQILVTLIK